MAAGKKTGGRVKGVPNKDKQALKDQIERKWPGYHPVIAMAAIANDDTNDIKIRFDAHKEVAQYVEPKRKALEIEAGAGMKELVLNIMGRDG